MQTAITQSRYLNPRVLAQKDKKDLSVYKSQSNCPQGHGKLLAQHELPYNSTC